MLPVRDFRITIEIALRGIIKVCPIKDNVINLETVRWCREVDRDPGAFLEKILINDALFGSEVMSRYRQDQEPEGQSSKQQTEPDPSEPTPESRLIPFLSKRREPDA